MTHTAGPSESSAGKRRDKTRTAAPPPLAKSRQADPWEEVCEFLRAIHVMKLYAGAEGIAIPDRIRVQLADLAPVEAAVAAMGTDPHCDKVALQYMGVSLQEALGKAIAVHSALSKLVAPATPDSIVYTQPPTSLKDFANRQAVLFWLLVAAFLAIGGFLGSLVWASKRAEVTVQVKLVLEEVDTFEDQLRKLEDFQQDTENLAAEIDAVITDLSARSHQIEESAQLVPQAPVAWPANTIESALGDVNDRPASALGAIERIREATQLFRRDLGSADRQPRWTKVIGDQLTNLFAAMLGAAFYTLYTANTYIVRRTFDRAYTTHYIARFVLGVLAGVILANFGEYVLLEQTSGEVTESVLTLTQTLLALIGGYSADAVNAIFTRVAETMTTLVRGSGRTQSDRQAEADARAADVQAQTAVAEARLAEVSRLQGLHAKAVESGAPGALLAAIKSQIDALLKEASA
ncbi:MAG TPA: hypothetical protein VD971_01815 [Phycisphaerales bacterium]|nr:hypothetical protein [Phycisphaerales bacterium]